MPRQVRKDLSYFTVDCDIFSAKSGLKSLIDRFQADGLAVYIHILCDVYGTGYYFKPDNYEDYLYSMVKDIGGITVEKVQLIIAFMADRTLLDAFSLNKNTVFTSHGIQKRYAQALKGRKRSVAEIKGEYWLLTDEEEQEIDTFYKTHPFTNKSEKIGDKSEKIGDKSEIYSLTEQKETERNLTNVVGLSCSDYSDLCAKLGKDTTDYYIERVKAFKERNPQANFNIKTTILKWWREDNAKGKKIGISDSSADEINAAFEKLNEEL